MEKQDKFGISIFDFDQFFLQKFYMGILLQGKKVYIVVTGIECWLVKVATQNNSKIQKQIDVFDQKNADAIYAYYFLYINIYHFKID